VTEKPTIFDVAQLAGVSTSTVSRTVNGHAGVSPELRARVLEAIGKLGYDQDYMARGLATRTSTTIGLIVTDIRNPAYAELIRGAEAEANSRGYDILFCNTAESAEKEASYMKTLRRHRVAGIVISATRMNDEHIVALVREGTPFVLVNKYMPDLNCPCVRTDTALGARLATSHLLERHHRRILLLNGPPASQSAQLRQQGYLEAFAACDAPVDVQLMRSCQPSIDGGYSGITECLDAGLSFTAVFAYNDLVAVGVLDALRDRKIEVPGTIAVASFDDTILASHTSPPLTSVHQDMDLLGRAAVKFLLDVVQGEPMTPRHTVLEPTLVIRESSGGVA
jgi:LacI family transcriptional regulator